MPEHGQLFIGPAGWSYEDWKGIVYPPAMPKSHHALAFLCQYFDTVEINSTFYHPANPRYAENWVGHVAANPRFKFTAKLWERFTHVRTTPPGSAEIERFREGIAPLHDAGILGALLLQFPWSFKRTDPNRRWLGRIAEAFDGYPLALEIRHTSWARPEVYESLRKRNIAWCNIDQPLFDDSIEPSAEVTASIGYVRFHGRNRESWFRDDAGRDDRYDYLYSEEELRPWVTRIDAIRKKARETYVVTNNHFRGQAVANAFELQSLLGETVPALPPHLVDHYPRLRPLERPGAGGEAENPSATH